MKQNRNPWTWVPTVYIFEGLPNAIVNTVSLIVFKNMGMPNDKLTLYTSLLSFPWVLKIVLSPFVDTVGRKAQHCRSRRSAHHRRGFCVH